MRKLFMFAAVLALASCGAAPAFAQNAPSGSPRVQGVPAGYGDPVQVTIRNADGSAPTAGGDASAANQTTQITAENLTNTTLGAVTASPTANTIGDRLKTINTTLGSVFQTGGSIGNTTFGATQATASSLNAQVVGAVAAAATDSGNPVKTGCYAKSTAQTAVTNAQRQNDWCFLNGQRAVTLVDSVGTEAIITSGTDGQNNTTNGLIVYGRGFAFNGASWDRLRGDASGIVTQPYALTGSRWQYVAAAGGITNTSTAVTVKAAAGASVINYVTGIQCTFTALGAATEFGLRDGAGGSFLWRMYVSTAGGTFTFVGPVPLKGTANTLVEVVTLTPSVTGAGYCNVQGYTAS